MFCARLGLIPPKEWHHSKMMKDVYLNTVAILLAYNNVIPPASWMHDVDLKNICGHSIKACLESYGLYYYNDNLRKF